MLVLVLINIFICLIFLKFYYYIFEEKMYYPFRVAEIYAFFTSNIVLFLLNFFFDTFSLALTFLFFNTLFYYIFYHIINMIQTSPRTKILLDLLDVDKINLDEYNNKYNLNVIVENRLQRFNSSKQIKQINGDIIFNDKKSFFLNLLSLIFLLIKKI